jgi:hypothetical protein
VLREGCLGELAIKGPRQIDHSLSPVRYSDGTMLRRLSGGRDRGTHWGRAHWTAIHPFNLEGAYVNFMMDDEVQGRVQATYGENYEPLASVKATYDPENLFRVNQNILPAAS